ncbi:MAG TPA: phosphatidylglycerol lysyltransferase domain-containing protein [Polyangiaceae bacterium]|nr:phosphatidylglycerol lysyltransferase domain-containing protein [Polyangiaceae bacterium]
MRRFGGGDLIASATLQAGVRYLDTSYGFWAYRAVRGGWVTLGGPICDAADRAAMLDRLLAATRAPLLCYVRGDLLAALDAGGGLRARGLYAAGMGQDHHADVDALLASPGPEVRSAVRKARRAGVRLVPFELSDADAEGRAWLAALSHDYLRRAEMTREMSFLIRPLTLERAGARRAFWLTRRGPRGDRDDERFGVVVLNPVYDRGQRTAYLLDVLRFEKTRLWGVWLSTVFALAELLKREGLGLSLGFCPLHEVARPPHGASRALGWQMERLERLVGSAQYLTSLRRLKSLIPHTREPRYFAAHSRSAPAALARFTEALGVGVSALFGPDLLRVLGRGVRGSSREARP